MMAASNTTDSATSVNARIVHVLSVLRSCVRRHGPDSPLKGKLQLKRLLLDIFGAAAWSK